MLNKIILAIGCIILFHAAYSAKHCKLPMTTYNY